MELATAAALAPAAVAASVPDRGLDTARAAAAAPVGEYSTWAAESRLPARSTIPTRRIPRKPGRQNIKGRAFWRWSGGGRAGGGTSACLERGAWDWTRRRLKP